MPGNPLPTEEALPQIRECLENDKACRLVVTGNSMFPFLRNGIDAVILCKADKPLKKGDIAFYLRASGQCVLHRVISTASDPLLFCGDAQLNPEEVQNDCVIASVSAVQRGKKLIPCSKPSWRIASGLWMMLRPMRPLLIRIFYHFTPSGRKILKESRKQN